MNKSIPTSPIENDTDKPITILVMNSDLFFDGFLFFVVDSTCAIVLTIGTDNITPTIFSLEQCDSDYAVANNRHR